jgi:hypothetical protein
MQVDIDVAPSSSDYSPRLQHVHSLGLDGHIDPSL